MRNYIVEARGLGATNITARDPHDAICKLYTNYNFVITSITRALSPESADASVTLNGKTHFYNVLVVNNDKNTLKGRKVYLVTAVTDKYNTEGSGVEIAGIFSDNTKGATAKYMVQNWLNEQGFTDGEVFCTSVSIDQFSWYDRSEIL